MYLSQIKLYNFRNLRDQTLELQNSPVYITGRNGNGKTNLVEAIYLLSGSRSFRTNSQSELVKWGEREASVFASVVKTHGTQELGISITPGQRTAFINNQRQASVAELVGACSVVAFSPAELALVKGPPAGRRRFLDRHTVDLQPSSINVLMAYQRALESKSALLKNQGVGFLELEPWNELLTEYGGKIVDNRINLLNKLVKKARKFHQMFAQTDGELGLELESDLISSEDKTAVDTKPRIDPDRIRADFKRVGQRELTLRSSVFGPHRDDIAITLNGVDARAYASQGQTRSIVLALKLGIIELLEEQLQESPIVILDDVDSELDATRSKNLFRSLSLEGRQVFITGTAQPPDELRESKSGLGVQLLEVNEGQVTNSSTF